MQAVDRGLRRSQPGIARLRTCTLDRPEVNGEALAIPLWLNEAGEHGCGSPKASCRMRTANTAQRRPERLEDRSLVFPELSRGRSGLGGCGVQPPVGRAGRPQQNGVIRFYREIGDWGVERFYNDILQGAREEIPGRSCRSRSPATWTARNPPRILS